jgi:hypothetical protein
MRCPQAAGPYSAILLKEMFFDRAHVRSFFINAKQTLRQRQSRRVAHRSQPFLAAARRIRIVKDVAGGALNQGVPVTHSNMCIRSLLAFFSCTSGPQVPHEAAWWMFVCMNARARKSMSFVSKVHGCTKYTIHARCKKPASSVASRSAHRAKIGAAGALKRHNGRRYFLRRRFLNL